MPMDEKEWQTLLQHMRDSFVSLEFGFDDRGQPLEPVIIETNQAFEELTGYCRADLIGREMKSIVSGIEQDNLDWLVPLEEVARTGESTSFQFYANTAQKMFKITAYSSGRDRVSVLLQDCTEMREKESKLQNQARGLSELMTHSRDMIIRFDKQLQLLYCNETAQRVLGITDSVSGKSVAALKAAGFTKEQVQTLEQALKSCLYTGVRQVYEQSISFPDGNKTILITMEAERDFQGKPVSLLVFFRASHSLERECSGSEEKYRLMFEHAPLGILHIDQEGRIAECNDLFVQIIGSSRQALLNLETLKLPDAKMVQTIRKALNGEFSMYEGLYESMTADKVTPVRVLFAPLGEGKTLTGAIGIVEDITRRKAAEDALRENEKNLKITLDSIGDGVIATDIQGRVQRMNAVAEELTGFSLDKARGRHLEDIFNIVDSRSLKPLPNPVEVVLEKGEATVLSDHVMLIKNDGTQYQISDSAAPIKDEKGLMSGVVLVFRDSTEEYRMQEALKKSEELFQKMLSLVPDMISIHDPEMNIVYSNWQGFGAVPEEKRILQSKCYTTYRGYDEVCSDCQASDVLQSKKAFQSEVELSPGQWIELRVIPLLDEEGEVELFVEWVRDISESKKMEADLISQNSLMEGIINGVPDVLAIQYPDYSIELYNEAGYSLLEKTHAEVRNRKCYELLGRDTECETCATRMALKSKKLESIQQFRPELGLFLDCRSNPILNEEGQVEKLVVQLRDITDHKQKEVELAESERKYRQITENITDVVWVADRNFSTTFVSSSIEKLTGDSVEEYLSKTIEERYPPQAIRQIHRIIKEELEKERDPNSDKNRSRLFEVEHYTKDGGLIWVSIHASFVRDEGGKPIALQCVTRNITDRKMAEEALRKSEERYRSIITVSNTGAWEYHRDIDYLWCSPEYFLMLGYDPEEFPMDGKANLEKNWTDLLHPEDQRRAARKFADYLLHSQGMYDNHFRMKHKEGHWVWIWSRGQTLRDRDNQPLEVTVGTHIDITESRQAEEKLRYISFHDTLTGLYNRAFLEEEMGKIDLDEQLPLTIIMVDVNGLKLVNDTYGHEKGDEMLKRTAAVLQQSCREGDIIARWGGDEFVVFLPRTGEEEASRICAQLMDACKQEYIMDIPLSLSSGFASKKNVEMQLSHVLTEAEDIMYQQKLTESRSAKNAALEALLKTLAAKSYETEAHTRGMQKIAVEMGSKLGLPGSELSRLELLITLHDIGKINISEEILTKKGPLDPDEWAIIKRHPEIGHRIAQAMPEFAHVAEDILSHHEKWDGSGYPRGLSGDTIPVLARITAIADAYEVMSNGRPYKAPMAREEIIAEFKRCSGKQFDPELIPVFLGVLRNENKGV